MDTVTRSATFTLSRDENGDGRTLCGYAAVFNSPTRIRGEIPAEFDEVILPGAFKRTINAKTPVLMFDHGTHPLIGSIPLGQITTLREDARGLYVEARLTDNWLIDPIRDAIADGAVDGMSFRFSIPEGKADWDRSGDVPLRSIREVNCMELGPVVFPAYQDTAVAVRGLFNSFDEETRSAVVDVFRELAEEPEVEADPEPTIQDQIEAHEAAIADLRSQLEDVPTEEDVTEPDTQDEPAERTSDPDPSTQDTDPPPDSTRSPMTNAEARLVLLRLRKRP